MITLKEIAVGNIIAPESNIHILYKITSVLERGFPYGYVELVDKTNSGKLYGKENSITFLEWWVLIRKEKSLQDRIKELKNYNV